jgi:hypothetical protein
MRARLALVVALGAVGGCGRGPLLDPVGASAGMSGAVDGAAGAGGVPSPPSPPDHPCMPGHDETCNEDPSISSLCGSCEMSGQCVCFDGRSINPATGRCRLGDVCTASAHDPWTVAVGFDVSNCAQRPATECTPIISGSKDPAAVIGGLAMLKCHFPADQILRVELVSGCPIELEAGYGFNPDLGSVGGAAVVTCLQKLFSSLRLACGSGEDCIFWEFPSGIIP